MCGNCIIILSKVCVSKIKLPCVLSVYSQWCSNELCELLEKTADDISDLCCQLDLVDLKALTLYISG